MHSSLSIHFTLLTPGGEDEGDGEGLCSQDPQQVGDAQETSGQHQTHSQIIGVIPKPHSALASFPDQFHSQTVSVALTLTLKPVLCTVHLIPNERDCLKWHTFAFLQHLTRTVPSNQLFLNSERNLIDSHA